jgi:hypothetical protein
MSERLVTAHAPDATEVLWILRRGEDEARVELISHGVWGWESHARVRSGLHYGQRFADRDSAMAHAAESRTALLASGWR